MVVQTVLEIVFMLLVAAFIGYKIGSLVEQGKTRKVRNLLKKKEQKLEELDFDLHQCVRVRRRLQSQLYNLQKELEAKTEVPAAMVNSKGAIITPEADAICRKEAENKRS